MLLHGVQHLPPKVLLNLWVILIDERTETRGCAMPTRATWSRLNVLLPPPASQIGPAFILSNEIVDLQIEASRP